MLDFDELAERIHEEAEFSFSTQALYTPPVGPQVSCLVVFDEAGYEHDPSSGAWVEMNEPRATVRLSTFTPEHTGILEIKGKEYVIVGMDPDGRGSVKCRLQRNC